MVSEDVLTILVVDDEPDAELLFRQRFRKELKRGELTFLFFRDGNSTLAHLKESRQIAAILVLSDINMPGMSGIELLEAIKKDHPQMLVYMITAYGDSDTEALAKKKGADDFMTKPVDFGGLKEKIEKLRISNE